MRQTDLEIPVTLMDETRLIELLVELHDGLPRLGPGDAESTLKALALCEELPAAPAILDIGCGTGAQTLVLAAATAGHVTAMDRVPAFLRRVDQTAAEQRLTRRIRTCRGDMNAPPFSDASFDLVWSEGAIYIMGFDRGLARWRSLVKPGGYLVVSELSWFRPDPPADLQAFWDAHYPALRGVDANLAAAGELGWWPAGHRPLPATAWTRDYYGPLRARIPVFRATHAGDPDAQAVADLTEVEMALMERYPDYCGYEFYVLRRPLART